MLFWGVKMLFISVAVSLLGYFPVIGIPANVIGIIIMVCGMSDLRKVSERLDHAYVHQIASLIAGAAWCVLLLILPAMKTNSGVGILVFLIFVCIIVLAGFGITATYHLFIGLDEQVVPCGIVYPEGRIRWCFYLGIITGAIAMFFMIMNLDQPQSGNAIQTIAAIAVSLARLNLLYEFMNAVKQAEEQ